MAMALNSWRNGGNGRKLRPSSASWRKAGYSPVAAISWRKQLRHGQPGLNQRPASVWLGSIISWLLKANGHQLISGESENVKYLQPAGQYGGSAGVTWRLASGGGVALKVSYAAKAMK